MALHLVFALALVLACLVNLTLGHSVGDGRGFTLGIRDSIMIAHSFEGEEFGPAQALHGATYTVDVEFGSEELEPKVNWVVDIGAASEMLSQVLQRYNFKNLNDLFKENTTTEFMCRAIHGDLCSLLKAKSWRGSLRVKLHESHKAWAEYAAPVPPAEAVL